MYGRDDQSKVKFVDTELTCSFLAAEQNNMKKLLRIDLSSHSHK